MTDEHAVLAGRDLSWRMGSRTVLDSVCVQARAGEIVGVVGPSGSGKSTLLALLAGLLPPDGGDVLIDGAPLGEDSPGGTRRDISVVMQGNALVTLLTATENVAVALRAAGRAPRSAAATAEDFLRRLGADTFGHRLVHELSGGQQQRVAVARALALGGRVLIADEPTAEQDAAHRELILDELSEAAHGERERPAAAVVVATHDPATIERCDSVVALSAGRVVAAP